MDLEFAPTQAWAFNAIVIGFYFLLFMIIHVIKAARAGKLIIDGKLVMRNVMAAALEGCTIPTIFTIGGLSFAVAGVVFNEPRGSDYFPPTVGQNLAAGVTTVHLLMVVALILAAVYGILLGIRRILRTVHRLLLAPIGRGIANLYRSIRPSIPVRW